MTDTPAAAAPEPSAESPYGPADRVDDHHPGVVAAPSGDSAVVTRARRTLRNLAMALPLVGVVLIIVAIVLQVVTGGAYGIDPLSEISGLTLTFIGPTLLVLGLHMIVWRAMVRPLSRMTPGSRVGMIIGIGGVLSFLSVILVFILVFIGFMILSLLFSATDQAM